jgi:hypothetical protein
MAEMMDKMDNMINLLKEKEPLPLPLNIKNDVCEFGGVFELFEKDNNDIVLPWLMKEQLTKWLGKK